MQVMSNGPSSMDEMESSPSTIICSTNILCCIRMVARRFSLIFTYTNPQQHKTMVLVDCLVFVFDYVIFQRLISLYKYGCHHFVNFKHNEERFMVLMESFLYLVSVVEICMIIKNDDENGKYLFGKLPTIMFVCFGLLFVFMYNIILMVMYKKKLRDVSLRIVLLLLAMWMYYCKRMISGIFYPLFTVYYIIFGEGDASKQFELIPSESSVCLNNNKTNKTTLDILFIGFGTRGDIQPMVALGQAMMEINKNCNVSIVAPREHKALVETYGLTYKDGNVSFDEDGNQGLLFPNETHLSQVITKLVRKLAKQLPQFIKGIVQTTKSADLIITLRAGSTIAFDLSEIHNCPVWLLVYSPDASTRSFPPPGTTSSTTTRTCSSSLLVKPIRSIYNYTSWMIYWLLIVKAFAQVATDTELRKNPPTKLVRKLLAMKPLNRQRRFEQDNYTPTLYVFSNVVVPKPADYPINTKMCGWFQVKSDKIQENKRLEIENFVKSIIINTNNKIIVVSFGSMNANANRFGIIDVVYDTIHDMLLSKTHSVNILFIGRKAYVPKKYIENKNCFQIESIPHDMIFPHCSAIIHHGGAGTTGTSLRFGLPSIVIPILLWTDQPWWADRVDVLKVGFSMKRKSITKNELAEKLGEILKTNSPLKCEAEKIAKQMVAKDDGAEKTAKLILSSIIDKTRFYCV